MNVYLDTETNQTITAKNKKEAETLSKGKVKLIGKAERLDEESAQLMGVKGKRPLIARNIELRKGHYGEHWSGKNAPGLILLKKDAPASTFYHEIAHDVLLKPRSDYNESPQEHAKDEIRTELYMFQKTGLGERNKKFLRGLTYEIAETYSLSVPRTTKIVLKELKKQKVPKLWIENMREIIREEQ